MNIAGITQLFRSVLNIFDANNLTKKAFLNSLASILDYSAKIIVSAVITPFLVSGLGDFYYGAWQILLRFIGYMSPASGRPTQALKFVLAKEQYLTDFERKRVYVGSTITVLAIFSPLLILSGAILSWYIPYWIKVPEAAIWNVRIACGILVLNLIAITITAVPQAALEGENKGYKRMGLATIIVFIGGGLTWLALSMKSGIIGVSIAALLLSLVQFIFYTLVVRSYSPWFGVARPSRNMVGEFLKLSGWFMAWNLINNLMLSADVVVLGLLNSAESVTTYTLSKYAPETLIALIAMIVFAILPGLSGIIGSGDMAKAAKVRGEIMTLAWLVATAIGTVILLWNRTFIAMWVGSSHYVGELANLLIVCSVIQLVLIRNDANIIDLTLRLRDKVLIGALSVTISILISSLMILVFHMSVIGVIVGIITGRLVLSVSYPRIIGKTLNITFASQIKASLRPALVSMLLFLGAIEFNRYLPSPNWHALEGWVAFMFFALLSAGFILVLAFFFGLTGVQRKQVLKRVQAVLHTASEG